MAFNCDRKFSNFSLAQWRSGHLVSTQQPTDNRGGASTSAVVNILVANVQAPPATEFTLIQTGAVWKYLDNGSDQGVAWRASAFDDSAWKAGPAELGYGDGGEKTVVIDGPSGASTNRSAPA